MMPTTPCEQSNSPQTEGKKTTEDEAGRAVEVAPPNDEAGGGRDWFESHSAFEGLHADMGQVASLAEAAHHALTQFPRSATAEGRRAVRAMSVLVQATYTASRESLRKWDKWIDEYEGQPIYYDGTESADEAE